MSDNDRVVLTQVGPEGIRYDFMDGCRVWVPEGARWTVSLRDVDTDTVLFFQEINGSGMVQSLKRYYVRFEITVCKDGSEVFTHVCDLKDREVLIVMQLGGLGDHIAWVGQAAAFVEEHGCRASFLVNGALISLFEDAYPHIRFIDEEDVGDRQYYARYRVLVFFGDREFTCQPNDYRQTGLSHMGAYILGLPPQDRKPRIVVDPGGRPMEEPYVCIGAQASGLSKYWNNPRGWYDLIRFLKEKGYKVVCIDKDRVAGPVTAVRTIPYGAQDETGPRPLTERARWLKHAEFFVGTSSGLSWLAWAAGARVVMISGYTEPYNEFYTPYRVINRHVCNGCANDVNIDLQAEDPFFCPHHKGTERMFECSRGISFMQVKKAIERIPGFGELSE
ncbi:autotransporter strand-loop-strand O-heptosyltransferase [Parasaccharibacter sp. TMW 2.1888]|uniref:autotransporter strand-loop-strand O-heptosyltransferase n=1 Tax=Parasaccharibacter sp. TMW 2.1888 TaxID=2268025 RepID=UPI00205367A5|nr:autotransporter strand-loop-strand O-heptosyltransferase [Parasaccharibacter sp. TMW 2.1888]UPO79562.1 autotransporter strand-loop-strand O-heptosyltransferase [Parasaccharibacter sp. TMW 2.1888]